ncbi:MAG: hypothetical protein NT000_06175 [Proteobacteria bacterium]|nr:hypothetical protein [Pseudomonadota bacterium]
MSLVMHSLRRRKNQGLRGFVVAVMLISFCFPSPATAVSMGRLKGVSGFKAMVIAIANLNFAMNQAAINPMDDNRRRNVAIAYGMMPIAIMALGKDFKNNQLHDKDFPFVQGILGGFVQKDLSSKVQAFMKDPSKENIPSVGEGFPRESLQQVDNNFIVGSKEKSLLATTDEEGNPKGVTASTQSDLIDLDSRTAAVASTPKNSQEKSNAMGNDTIVANKSLSLLNSPEAKESGRQDSESFKAELANDIQSAESAQAPIAVSAVSTVRAVASKTDSEVKGSLDNDFFKVKKGSKKQIQNKRIRKGGIKNNRSLLSQPHRKSLALYLWDGMFGADAAAEDKPCQGDQSSCSAGGGQGGGQGGGAGELLFGLAAIMAATAPIVAASMQASADKKIAQINANTAIANATTQANLQKFSIEQQSKIAKDQAEAVEKLAKEKNEKEMAQLQMQLGELKQGREQQAALEREKRDSDRNFVQQEIALKQQAAAQTIQLAQQQRLAAETAQGLNTGFQTGRDSGGRLQINPIGRSGNSLAGAAQGNLAARNNSSISGFANTTTNKTGTAIANGPTSTITATKSNVKAAQTLVASATQSGASRGITSIPGSYNGVSNALSSPRDPKSPNRGIATLAKGSSRNFKQQAALPLSEQKGSSTALLALNRNGNSEQRAVVSGHTANANQNDVGRKVYTGSDVGRAISRARGTNVSYDNNEAEYENRGIRILYLK